MTMIDHLSIYARDFAVARSFYEAVFAALGHSIQAEFETEDDAEFPGRRVCGFGSDETATFWIIETRKQVSGRHIAFTATDHRAVDKFHRVALQSGGRDNGAPGFRPEYHSDYYASFIIDPDGNDIEAVCHHAGGTKSVD
jgi:catechol 2,3-dioxygenase-like lactoylglutathione lyase family enzyme